MSKRFDESNKYQVWITEYPLDGNSESSKYDPGYQLVGTFNTIEEAVECHRRNESYKPYITKFVTWQTKIMDITDMEATHE